ncbi:MAG: GNAT family N-acetyltransferase [Pirellulales bacterium]
MPLSETPKVVVLARHDLEAAQRLVAAAGWNQVVADWEMFLEDGRIFGCKDEQGRIVATAATMPYRQVGWISLMLVDEGWRRRGLATRLMTACIDTLEGAGLTPALDATPVGREVYLQMGFRDVLPLTRWAAQSPAAGKATTGGVRALANDDIEAVVKLDLPIFEGGRRRLLERLMARSRDAACVAIAEGAVEGFLLGREGRVFTHLGPLFAPSLKVAAELLEHALGRQPGPTNLDVPDAQREFGRWLATRGFAPQRTIMRMVRSPRAPELASDTLFAVAGPDLG